VAGQHGVLLAELRRHDPALAARPRVVAVNKVDLPGGSAAAASLAAALDRPVHAVSAVTGEGVEGLMHAVADVVEQAVREAPGRRSYLLHRPAPAGFSIRREGERWVVTGKAAERAVALDDLTVPETADSPPGASPGRGRRGAAPGRGPPRRRSADRRPVFEFQEDEGPGPEGAGKTP